MPATTRKFENIVRYMKKDAKIINISFNYKVAELFEQLLKKSARDWYDDYKVDTEYYFRSYQLEKKAIIFEKSQTYKQKISFSPKNIETAEWEEPFTGKGLSKSDRYKGTMGHYTNLKGKNVASLVLDLEEQHMGYFSRYDYEKGDGIYGSALKELINQIDSISIAYSSNIFETPESIVNGLIETMKEGTKKILQDRYDELYK